MAGGEDLIYLSAREKVLLAVLAVLVAGFLLFYYVYQPVWQQARHLKAQEQSLAQWDIKLDSSPDYQSKQENLQKKWEDVAEMLPVEAEIEELVDFISQTARQNQVLLLGLQVPVEEPEPVADPVNEFKMKVSVSGSYPKLLSLVKDIEQASRLISIDHTIFTIQSASGQNESPHFKLNEPEMIDDETDNLLPAEPELAPVGDEGGSVQPPVQSSPVMRSYTMELYIRAFWYPIDPATAE